MLRSWCTFVHLNIINRIYCRLDIYQTIATVVRSVWGYIMVAVIGINSYNARPGTVGNSALIAAGKVGSSIGAELGSMRVTEQIDAMEVSGTKPFKFLVCTRVIATTLTIPILATYTGFIAILGGYINVAVNEGTSYATYMQQVFDPLSFTDFTHH
jgi:ABC-type transporter Mla maintaining outer membrane lipid asymmetry permease subunit MlaE